MIVSLNLLGAIHPSRYPGAKVLEIELHHKTRPSSSNALQGLGRLLPKYTSPYRSSSINGIFLSVSICTTSFLCSSGIQLPSGLLKLDTKMQALILCKTFLNASGSIPVMGCVGNSNTFNPKLFASCKTPKYTGLSTAIVSPLRVI